MEQMKKKRGKLQAEISLITVIIFAVILFYSSFSYYHETKDAFLRSKYEMFDRDLENIRVISSQELIGTPWFWTYAKAHAEDMTRPLTEEEAALGRDAGTREAMLPFLEGQRNDFEACEPAMQLLLSRIGFQTLSMDTDYLVRKFHYADISYLDFPNDREAYIYLTCSQTEPDGSAAENQQEFYAVSWTECFTSAAYLAAEHTAVKQLLAEGPVPGKTLYEEWTDPQDGRSYCVGYIPIDYDGEISCYARIRYDWTDFLRGLNRSITVTVLWAAVLLAVLNGILLLLIRKRATQPLARVTDSILAYMEDKDSGRAREAMKSIRCKNEIGVLADSFSAMTGEIDRYTKEALRLGAEKERVATELALAGSIQEDALPRSFPAFPDRPEFDLHAVMVPARQVGGDFYDFFLIDADHLALVIADVSGKGIPASLFMMSSKILLNDHALMGGTPAEILERVNRQVCASNHAHMFVTVWLGILEISTGRLTSASAGHEYPMLRTRGAFELLKDKHGMPIGVMKKTRYTNTEIQLKKGDSLFVYTDGVAEAANAQEELFGTERTLEALNALPGDASPQRLLAGVSEAVAAFVQDAPQFDDLTMLSVKYYGPEGSPERQEAE